MTVSDALRLAGHVVAGLGLFIFGIQLMAESLRATAGGGLRRGLERATRWHGLGMGFGTALGFLAHSSGATVMLVGLVDAGLLTVIRAVPPVLGANLGTALAMQVVAFRLGDYAYVMLAVGFVLGLLTPWPWTRRVGRSLLGFGLLFLGLAMMSDAIRPHRETLGPMLLAFDADTLGGRIATVAAAALFTTVVQSSGATIFMAFALIEAGVYTRLGQTAPLVLGAQVGTCATALLASAGAGTDARRTAVTHLLFNLLNALAGLILFPLLVRLIEAVSPPDVVRQTANFHTFLMATAGLLWLIRPQALAALACRVWQPGVEPAEPSRLEDGLLDYPEEALAAAVAELRRTLGLCASSLDLAARGLVSPDRADTRAILRTEDAVDAIKVAAHGYLMRLTDRYLSRRQAILCQYLYLCFNDAERIGDHIETIAKANRRRRRDRRTWFDTPTLNRLARMFITTRRILEAGADSLRPGTTEFKERAQSVLEASHRLDDLRQKARAEFMEGLAEHRFDPLAGVYFFSYLGSLAGISRHTASIAFAEQQSHFWIKREKLGRRVRRPSLAEPVAPIQRGEYLQFLAEGEPVPGNGD